MLGYGLVLLAAASWGIIGPVARFAYTDSVTPIEVAFWRALIGSLFFFLHFSLQRLKADHQNRGPLLGSQRDRVAFLFFGVFGVATFYGTYFYTVEQAGAGVAAVLLYTAPIWVLLFETLLPGKASRIPPTMKVAAILASLIGVLLVGGGGTFGFGLPLVTGLLAGFCYSLYYLLPRLFSSEVGAPQIYAWSLLIGAGCLWPWVPFHSKSLTAWTAIAVLALVSTYFAFLCLSASIERVGDPSLVAIVATAEPLFAAVLDGLVWSQTLSLLQWVGFTLILGAGLGILLKDQMSS